MSRPRNVSAALCPRSAPLASSELTLLSKILPSACWTISPIGCLGDAETIEGHKTYKVEATPVDRARSQYKFLYYWVAQDAPVILHAEMYDAQGREVRVLHASGLKRVSGIWGARHMEMSSVQDRTRTVLSIEEVKFNTNVDEKLFTPQGLEGAHGSGIGQ